MDVGFLARLWPGRHTRRSNLPLANLLFTPVIYLRKWLGSHYAPPFCNLKRIE